ncbi:TPR domain protein [Cordyceps fumosorosea ARSEF 2679]|uniref:TPR domain protein n=1 Tax=Cordyceps fumosorosea (strain ARSEF 2679) TaxID=1081104 RepID=A0A168B827_CORFA|nr:TPR domain protein [Cordyceps fumosorosea ARSEF 2679]OAA69751.1 TPR domain protein [Cordyceps fumosorosea ARSEF 2679]
MTRKLVTKVKATYPSSFPDELPRPELQMVYFSAALMGGQVQGRPLKEMLLEGLRALGYSVVVIWPDRCRAAAARVESVRWDTPAFPVPLALFRLYVAAKETAPSLAKRILWRKWIRNESNSRK